jgi:catechol 2,3-dioxygenase-like lactoylglutathione lyase family enzyme
MTLQHVALETPLAHVEDCVDFWAILGFERVDPPPSLAGIATWLQRERMQIHLLHADEPVIPPQGHPAVVVDEYEETLDALRAAGHEPEPRREHWGQPRAFVLDPAGHRVEVMAAPPPPTPGGESG